MAPKHFTPGGHTRTGMAAALTIGAILLIAPGALAGQVGPQKQIIARQPVSARVDLSVMRDRWDERGRDRGQHESRGRRGEGRGDRDGHRGRDWGRDHDRDRGRDWGRDRDRDRGRDCEPPRRGGDDCDDRGPRKPDCGPPVSHPALLGTLHIDKHCVEVRQGRVFEALLEAARCAGYQAKKVKVDGRTYIRIYGCPKVCFDGAGFELDVIRYYNDVIDIALFREAC